MAKQQSEIVVAAQKVAKAEAKKVKLQEVHDKKVAALVAEIEAERSALKALVEGRE